MKLYHVDGEVKVNAVNTSNYDLNCVKSALTNLFNFRWGQEILEPMYGNDIYRYLYEPMNKYTARKN